jgi:hypothetical protein
VSEQYVKELRMTFEHLIDAAQLDDHQREFLKLRWLDQLTWMESKAGKAQRFYYSLRLVTIIGAVVVPALVAAGSLDGWPGHAAQIGTWIVSLIVAISAAVEGFFQFGQRWRNYRSPLRVRGRHSRRRVSHVRQPHRGSDPEERHRVHHGGDDREERIFGLGRFIGLAFVGCPS